MAFLSILLGGLNAMTELLLASLLVPIFQIVKEGKIELPEVLQNFSLLRFSLKWIQGLLPKEVIIYLLILLLIIYVLSFIFAQLARWISSLMQESVAKDLSSDLYKKILRLKYDDLVNSSQGYYFTYLSHHILVIGSISGLLVQVILSTILSVAVFYYLVLISWKLVSAGALILGISALISRRVSTHTRRLGTNLKRKGEKRNGFLHETIEGFKTIKMNSSENNFISKHNEISEEFLSLRQRAAFFQDFSSDLLKYVLAIFFIILFIVLISRSDPSDLSNVEKYLLFFSLLSRAMGPLSSINNFRVHLGMNSRIIDEYINLNSSLELATPELASEIAFTEDLHLKNLDFAYKNTTDKLFDNLNLRIQRGKRTGIIGTSGSGKSTVIDLLMGIHEPSSGQLQVGDKVVSGKIVREHSSVVSNDSFLFNDTVLFNLTLGKSYSTEAVTQALIKAEAKDLVESLEGKWDYIIGPKGSKLSSGQRQRLLIARALLRETEIFVLDEGTNALDSRTEETVLENLHQAFAKKTIISVAHRLNIVKDYDHLIILESGKIVGQGTHEELLKSCLQYQILVRSFDKRES